MHIFPIIRDGYGLICGYRRLDIRRQVAAAAALSPESLAIRNNTLFKERVTDAIQQFPLYAAMMREHGGSPPVLTKTDIRRILATKQKVERRVIPHATGGSTGQPFRFFITRASFEWRSAVSDRGYAWALAEEGRRSFYVWGTAIHKQGWKQRIKEGVHHWLQNRQYFDSFHFDDVAKAECCRQLNRFKPVALVGYSGNLIELARYVQRNPGQLTWRAKTVVTAAEGLRPGMRALLEAHLADEVFMSYGSREFMLIGMECKQHDGYHIASDNLYVEVVDDDGRPLPPGELGRIVVTDLHNIATPFIRYEIGDLGVMGAGGCGLQSSACPCGLPFPVLKSVEGRLQEVIVRADGEKLTALFIPHLMKEFGWVDGYQVVQPEPGTMTMNLVTGDTSWAEKTGEIEGHLREKLGEGMAIGFERVEALEKNASGKTPIVLNHGRHGRHGNEGREPRKARKARK
jgi:phenylacetate-CoA ligase